MAEQLVNGKIGSEKQFVFFNTERIVGVQSVSVSQNKALSPLQHLGSKLSTPYTTQGQQSTQVSIDSLLLNKDYFIKHLTGGHPINMFILRDPSELNTCYSIISGHFSNYTCNYSIGNVPSISVGMVGYGNAGQIPTGDIDTPAMRQLNYIAGKSYGHTGLLVPYGDSISLNIDDFNTNRVQSFSISLDFDKDPIYKMGSRTPKSWGMQNPVIVQCNFVFEQGDYNQKVIHDFPEDIPTKNINVVVKDYSTDEVITSYKFDNLRLVSENSNSNVNNNVTISQTYEGIFYPSFSTGVAYDVDAADFFVRAGITSIEKRIAVNTLVTQLKDAGTWDYFDIIYPLIGGEDKEINKVNLKSSNYYLDYGDDDSWVTHSALGIKGDGSNPVNAERVTIDEYTSQIWNSGAGLLGGIVAYVTDVPTTSNTAGYFGTSFDSAYLGLGRVNAGSQIWYNHWDGLFNGIANTQAEEKGCLIGIRSSPTSMKLFKNGVEVAEDTTDVSSVVNTVVRNWYILSVYNGNNTTQSTIGFIGIAPTLTDYSKVTGLNDSIVQFQRELRRA